MKAIPFLQFYQNEPKASLRDNYLAIVSQPFVKEMIVELFEGFTFNLCDYFCMDKKGQKIRFEDFKIEFYSTKFSYLFPMPKTLNDFISDCQRAGIDLEFKEEITSKLLN
jgi:hypothetical protein